MLASPSKSSINILSLICLSRNGILAQSKSTTVYMLVVYKITFLNYFRGRRGLDVMVVGFKYTLENTEGAIKKRQSRETDNIGYTR